MELNRKLYRIDMATGFLESDSDIFTPVLKTRFLKDFKASGDLTAVADRLGVDNLRVEAHLALDLAFSEAFKSAKLEMKHKLEGLLFRAALDKNGHKARELWLKTQYPDEYGPGKRKIQAAKSSALEDLL